MVSMMNKGFPGMGGLIEKAVELKKEKKKGGAGQTL